MAIAAGIFALFSSFFSFGAVHAGTSHGPQTRRPAEAYGGIIDRPRAFDAHGNAADSARTYRSHVI